MDGWTGVSQYPRFFFETRRDKENKSIVGPCFHASFTTFNVTVCIPPGKSGIDKIGTRALQAEASYARGNFIKFYKKCCCFISITF